MNSSDPSAFHAAPADELPAVLSIAESDGDGGSGIQTDLRVFCALDVYGLAVPTGIASAQSLFAPISPELIRSQIEQACAVHPVRVAKTGFLHSAEIIRRVAAEDLHEGIPVLVVDPRVATADGANRIAEEALHALRTELLPQARVATPGLREAERLCGRPLTSVAELRAAARELYEEYDVSVVVRGASLPGPLDVDVLYDEGEEFLFEAPRLPGSENPEAGCAFSAALAAFLAHRELMCDAVGKAKEFVRQALLQARPVGARRVPNYFWHEPVRADA